MREKQRNEGLGGWEGCQKGNEREENEEERDAKAREGPGESQALV